MSYADLLQDQRWQRKRLAIFERDNWTCRSCGEPDKTLHVHHTYYERGNKPWEYPDWSLVTYCADCHRQVEETLARIHFAVGSLTVDYMLEPVQRYLDVLAWFYRSDNEEVLMVDDAEWIIAVQGFFPRLDLQDVEDTTRANNDRLTHDLWNELAKLNRQRVEAGRIQQEVMDRLTKDFLAMSKALNVNPSKLAESVVALAELVTPAEALV